MELELEVQRSLEPAPGSPGEGEWDPSGGAVGGRLPVFSCTLVGTASDFIPFPRVCWGVGCVGEEP